MLNKIECQKLLINTLQFKKGLNSVIGADDAYNSIGKSSVLMLIDFAFGGSDFISKCDDVINHIGNFSINISFIFDKEYLFIRSTDSSDSVFYVNEDRLIELSEYTTLLRNLYKFNDITLSFRNCVGPFHRIYQKNNYDNNYPFHANIKEKWTNTRLRLLKMFNCYYLIQELENQTNSKTKEQKEIKSTFSIGAIEKISKSTFIKNNKTISNIENEAGLIKNALTKNVTDISELINNESLKLKQEKDKLVKTKLNLESKIVRIESNLNSNKRKQLNNIEDLIDFFPGIDSAKISDLVDFHSGISNILNKQMRHELTKLRDRVDLINQEINRTNSNLSRFVDSSHDSVNLLENLIESSKLKDKLSTQNLFWSRAKTVKEEISGFKTETDSKIKNSLVSIENDINSGLKKYIKQIYTQRIVVPEILLTNKSYKFDQGDDKGTGKGFANLIALDLSLLDITCLPNLIHDSLLFKNMSNNAIEKLIGSYNSHEKQIFIAVDEILKFNKTTLEILNDSMFIKLDKDNYAFKKKWNESLK